MAKKGLGRGLDVLLGDIAPDIQNSVPSKDKTSSTIALIDIIPDPKQPRKSFDDEAIRELADSIREKGLLQPILVRPVADREGKYQIVAGERRWRACQQAPLHDVSVIIRDLSDQETAEIALIENIQRVDLNPIEEAEAYQALIAAHGHKPTELAKALGKSRSHIANMVRLLNLPDPVIQLVRDGQLSMGHARALLGAEEPETVAKYVIERELSVRDTEAYARASLGNMEMLKHGGKKPAKGKAQAIKDANILALEKEIAEALGLDIHIDHKDKEQGTLTISYQSLDQLDDICRRLKGASF
ncbi:MAG: ParB/RepB/Spo0J family partition protein [bacterium]